MNQTLKQLLSFILTVEHVWQVVAAIIRVSWHRLSAFSAHTGTNQRRFLFQQLHETTYELSKIALPNSLITSLLISSGIVQWLNGAYRSGSSSLRALRGGRGAALTEASSLSGFRWHYFSRLLLLVRRRLRNIG